MPLPEDIREKSMGVKQAIKRYKNSNNWSLVVTGDSMTTSVLEAAAIKLSLFSSKLATRQKFETMALRDRKANG